MESDIDDSAGLQLESELQESVRRAFATKRPILTHLNADTTWLLSLPYPDHVKPLAGRSRYNILIDPWLQGPQSDVASWFSTQWHSIQSSVETIVELNQILAETEALDLARTSDYEYLGKSKSFIDLVAISHEFTDHCHQATLLELPPEVPVFATTKATELIQSWNHFDTVVDMPAFSKGIDWRSTSISPLPKWLGVSRLVTKSDALYYHSAVIVCIEQSSRRHTAEAVIYTPHGVEAGTFSTLATAKPHVQTLAFLHGLHDVSIAMTKQLNLGALNALRAQKELRAKYWVGTHDEVKKGGGLIAPFLRRKAYTVLDALTHGQLQSEDDSGAVNNVVDDTSYVDLASGQGLLLE